MGGIPRYSLLIFTVYGIELSKPALELGAAWDPGTSFIAGSALEPQLGQPVDAVYCYDVLHLFLAGGTAAG
ncbi:hypothetical protein ACFTAO_14135 [Paenibacillus rhizoplanae]